jgi:hypothetical protein
MANPWFRMYTDFLNDPKMIALAFEDQRHFVGILALKSDGALDNACDETLLDRIVAQRLWIDHAVIRDVKRRLVAAGLIDSAWQPVAWDKRQCRSDKDSTGAERQRRFRENQDRNALRNADITRLDTDTEEDKETEQREKIAPEQAQASQVEDPPRESKAAKPRKAKAASFDAALMAIPEWLDDPLWKRWVKHRGEIKKPITEETAREHLKKLDAYRADGWAPDVVISHCIAGGYQGLFPPHGSPPGRSAAPRPGKFNPSEFVNRNRTQPGYDAANTFEG